MDINQKFEKLEDKIDQVGDNVNQLRTDFKVHVALIEEHVAGDKKIINEIQPILEAYKFEQLKKKEAIENREAIYKYVKITSGLSVVLTAFYTVVSYLRKLYP